MAQSVSGSLALTASAAERVTNGLSTGTLSPSLAVSLSFGNGTGNGNINYVFSKSATATAAADTYTLSALTDDLGRSVPLTKVRCIVIAHLGTVDNKPLTIGNAATHPWAAPFDAATDTISVRTGGVLVLAAPNTTAYAVTSGSSDQLKVDPGANTITYKIMIMGE